MLTLRGAPAVSEFRLQKLVAQIAADLGEPLRLSAVFMHFVDVERALNDEQMQVLGSLLDYGPAHGDTDESGQLFLVVPRPGTLSPWSSKATDIAHNCGLEQILRIERGIAYRVAGGNLGADARARVASHLHDRMTQTVLSDIAQAERLFVHAEPRPFTSVDVLAGGRDALLAANSELGLALSDDCPGQLGALSAQDLQCDLVDRWQGSAAFAVRDDPQHDHALAD